MRCRYTPTTHLQKFKIKEISCFFCQLCKIFGIFLLLFIFKCILGFGVHVKNMPDCCIGTHMAVWFAVFLPIPYIWHFSPCISSPLPTPTVPPISPRQTPVCDAPLPVSMCSHCSTPTYEWEHAVFDFLFLCQFAENDGFQVHPCSYKGYKLIIFYDCSIPWCICATFSQSSLSSMGIRVGSRSLLL